MLTNVFGYDWYGLEPPIVEPLTFSFVDCYVVHDEAVGAVLACYKGSVIYIASVYQRVSLSQLWVEITRNGDSHFYYYYHYFV